MVLTDCLRDWLNSASLAVYYLSCITESVPLYPQRLQFELTYALCELPQPDRLRGQEQSFLAWLWLQIIPQRFIADKGPREQNLRLRAQSGWERGEKVSCRWMENCRQESRYQLPWAKHVQVIKSPILNVSPVKKARLIPTGMLVEWWNTSQSVE